MCVSVCECVCCVSVCECVCCVSVCECVCCVSVCVCVCVRVRVCEGHITHQTESTDTHCCHVPVSLPVVEQSWGPHELD